MSNVVHQNPNNKHSLVKTKPTKRSPRSNKNKIKNIINTNNNNNPFLYNNNNNNNNNKPLKVVHISNPMKFEATPTQFRALVQELTGRDAVVDWSDDYHHRVNYQAAVAVSVAGGSDDGDGSSYGGGVTDDQDQVVVQEVHQDNNNNHHDDEAADVISFSGCFGPSDHLSFDCCGPFYDYEDNLEDFQAFMDDHH